MRTATGNPYLSGPGDFGLKSTSAPWTEATHFSLVRLQFTTPKEFHEIETNPIQLLDFSGRSVGEKTVSVHVPGLC